MAVSGWNNNRVVYIAFSESSEAKRYVQRWNKTERKYTNQTMGFVGRMDHKVAKWRFVIRMKKCCWAPFTWMVDIALRMHGRCIVLTKMKAMISVSPCFSKRCCQYIYIYIFFLKYSKGDRSFLIHVGTWNVP